MSEAGYLRARDGAMLYYVVDDFTDPWRDAETVVCIHGLAESTEAWRAWVPHLARCSQVVRFDSRGFGRSTPMPADHPWSLAELEADLDDLLSHVGAEKAHLIGWKSGGAIAMSYASSRPTAVRSLSVIGSHPVGPAETWLGFIEEHGVERWLIETMPRRLASLPPEAQRWWIDLMRKTELSTLKGYLRWYPTVNLLDRLPLIEAPTLIVAGQTPLRKSDSANKWRTQIRDVRFEQLPVQSSHLGAAYPDKCAEVVGSFIDQARRNACGA